MRELFATAKGHFRGRVHFGHGSLQRFRVAGPLVLRLRHVDADGRVIALLLLTRSCLVDETFRISSQLTMRRCRCYHLPPWWSFGKYIVSMDPRHGTLKLEGHT